MSKKYHPSDELLMNMSPTYIPTSPSSTSIPVPTPAQTTSINANSLSSSPNISGHSKTPVNANTYPTHRSSMIDTANLPNTLQAGRFSGNPPLQITSSDRSTLAAIEGVVEPQSGPVQESSYQQPARLGPQTQLAPSVEQRQTQFASAPVVPGPSQPTSATTHAPYQDTPSPQPSPLGLADIRQDGFVEDSGTPRNEDIALPSFTNSTYISPYPIYAFDWCKWTPGPDSFAGRVAVGTYLENKQNYLQIFNTQRAEIDRHLPEHEQGMEFVKVAEAAHSYPVTRASWEPINGAKQSADLVATSGDHLGIWSIPPENAHASYGSSIHRGSQSSPVQKFVPVARLTNSKSSEHTAPMTSLDWNSTQTNLIITSSIDTTCTIWDITRLNAKTQLIAHDREVYDVRFCANSANLFASCGADGSVRMFDLRSLDHSTIIYEPSHKNDPTRADTPPSPLVKPNYPPLLRLATSPHDSNTIATFAQDSNIVRVLDARHPGQTLYTLTGHSGPVNCLEWCPTRRGAIASGADDSLVLVWDLVGQSPSTSAIATPPTRQQIDQKNATSTHLNERSPVAMWRCDYEVSNISWSPPRPDLPGQAIGRNWMGICGGRTLWGVAI